MSSPLNETVAAVTSRIVRRSLPARARYLDSIERMAETRPARAHLACGNQAHAYAASGSSKLRLAEGAAPNLGIVTAYNDMLSAHQPYEDYPQLIREAASGFGATAQVAGGVPAMCDGVTQGQPGMELSLFSRDVIALAAAVALSHNTYDAVAYLGVCDKIVPGLVIAAAKFGHLPGIFLPAGPMTSGMTNDEKARKRQDFAAGKIGRDELMKAEMAAYHGPGTCTFYGTANSNQMLMEFMGLHLPGTSFVNPGTPLRRELTAVGVRRVLSLTALGNRYRPIGRLLSERAFVNGMVGLMATGGSTNLVIHMTAMARAAGICIELEDFSDLSGVVPLLARVYPNGLADVNQFHAAGGLGFVFAELLSEGLLHEDVETVHGRGLAKYATEPRLVDGAVHWEASARDSLNESIVRAADRPFAANGGIRLLEGNLGRALIKVSAVKPEHGKIEAPARVFSDQNAVKEAFAAGEFRSDCVVVVRFQGPKFNGMPELHSLTPLLSSLLDRGIKVALVTDGRMSGASGKVPAAIHVSPEAAESGLLAKLADGDILRLDCDAGTIDVTSPGAALRADAKPPLPAHDLPWRDLFENFRSNVGSASSGASAIA
ncbi:MAG: phosphogluconate dehydratase [Rhodobacteraceae bacterium]|nr:phosphogluconate dehydratase [Paracoccaceae bacterium]